MSVEKASRRWIAVAALVSGTVAAVGWLVAIFVSMATPEVTEITWTTAHGTPTVSGKAFFLFSMPAFETIVFLIALHMNIRWHHLVQKAAAQMAPYDVWQTGERGFSFPRICRATSIGFCVMSIVCLYFALTRANFVF